jgi:glyceraldehyde-3-phosphate dehydrogenase (NADP+)
MVHPKISKQFLAKFVTAVSALKVGLPWEEGMSITPLPEGMKKVEYLQGLIADATQRGAKVLNPAGGTVDINNSLMVPAVLFPVSKESRVYKEEQFGPVVPIVEFSSFSEISDYFKSTAYGQQAALFTRDSNQAATLVDLLSTAVGRVNINTQCGRSPDTLPFSGRRSSALGTMSVSESIRAFSVPTVVAGKSSAGFSRSLLDDIQSRSRYLHPSVISIERK